MTSPKLVFYLTCLFFGKMAQTTDLKISSSVYQESSFVSATTGENLTLRCFYRGDVAARFYWYKQPLGQKPRLMSTYYKYERNGIFHNEFKDNPRFTLDTEIHQNHLKMTDLRIADTATYYCASSYSYNFQFAQGTFVSVKGSGLNIPALFHQSASEIIQPGGSVTLNCTVHTGTCDGEHSVYWFKHSQESQESLISIHGGRNVQCERKDNTQSHTCVYNLPMKSLNLSHAGTYYCAVASCGHILFGDGTKLDFEDEVDSPVLVYFLSGALTFTVVLSILLAFSMCLIKKRNNCKCAESHARFTAPSTINAEGDQHEENLHYAALRAHRGNRSRRQKNKSETECVYSSVKQ
ncbi:immunoglobulin kappa light chain-like [Sparus aurata]|uniref:Immunoglobulin kappa light chain-like n=1 Tax=Sparus aurata TaxID=8175 RepID=A0A671XV35_SPAAU|nr:immunoglobulin kappa light chain-like [Sparus aurata]